MTEALATALTDVLDETLRQALAQLGPTAQDVANNLTRAGVTGIYRPDDNPVANYVRGAVCCDIEVVIGGASAAYCHDGTNLIHVGITTPEAIDEFLRRWDDGEYAHLKAQVKG